MNKIYRSQAAIQYYQFGAEPNVRPSGAVSPTGETIYGSEILLLRTPPGECNCISLHSTRRGSVHLGWVNISRVNSFINVPKFIIFFLIKRDRDRG